MKKSNSNPTRVVMTLLLLISVGIVLGYSGVPLAQSLKSDAFIVDHIPSKGEVDWTNGAIRATGIGVPPADAVSARHAREMAKRAARVVAYRNLLEIVQGVRVNSHTLVKNYMVEQDTINTKVQGIIHGARVIHEEEFPDGSFQVTVEMGLNSELSSALSLSPAEPRRPISFPPNLLAPEIHPSLIPGDLHTGPISGTPSPEEDSMYTGLVLDAQGFQVQRAMSPRVVMEDGREVYSAEYVKKAVAESQGIVAYVRGLSAAKEHARVTNVPLEVKVLRIDGDNKTDYVVSDADAQMLHVVPEHFEFLENARVLVVLD
ncbi:LPP20 family lipoprotein [Candidatus Nitrospira salsa]